MPFRAYVTRTAHRWLRGLPPPAHRPLELLDRELFLLIRAKCKTRLKAIDHVAVSPPPLGLRGLGGRSRNGLSPLLDMGNQILQGLTRVAHHRASDRFEHVFVAFTRTRHGERSNIGGRFRQAGQDSLR